MNALALGNEIIQDLFSDDENRRSRAIVKIVSQGMDPEPILSRIQQVDLVAHELSSGIARSTESLSDLIETRQRSTLRALKT